MSACHSFPSGIPTDLGFKRKMLGLDLFLHFFSCFVLLLFIFFFLFLFPPCSLIIHIFSLNLTLSYFSDFTFAPFFPCKLPPTCQCSHVDVSRKLWVVPTWADMDSNAPMCCWQQPCFSGYESRVLADVGVHVYRIFASFSTYLHLQILPSTPPLLRV